MHANMNVVSLLCLVAAVITQASPLSTAGMLNPITYDSQGGHATCVSGNIPVQVTSPNNVKINLQTPRNQYEVSQYIITSYTPILGMQQRGELLGPQQTVTGNYSIYSTLCVPKSKPYNNNKALQFLTHGIGFGQSYWDLLPGYSYVDVAAQSGATTFLYDRLGVGNSSKPDGIQVVQAPMELEIAHALIQKLKQGAIGGQKYPKIVGVGHSFGSFISQAITSNYPKDFAGVVLTSDSTNLTGLPIFFGSLNLQIAANNDRAQWGRLSKAYVVAQNAISQQQAFFHYKGFAPKVLDKVEQVKQTITLGELITQGLITKPAAKYTAPVFVVEGAYDLPFCFGNCMVNGGIGLQTLKLLYPAVGANGKTAVIDDTGHGLNLHTSAPRAFAQIQQFIASNNL